MNWISVEDELKPVVYVGGFSEAYPVQVAGVKGWVKGRYYESKHGSKWIIDDYHGEWEVTAWYDLPEPPTAPISENQGQGKGSE